MQIQCSCGQKYQIKDELAGQYIRCRKCGTQVLVQSEESAPIEVVRHPDRAHEAWPVAPAQGGEPLPASTAESAPSFPGLSQTYRAPAPVAASRPAKQSATNEYRPVNEGIRLVYVGTMTSVLSAICLAICRGLGLVFPAIGCVLGMIAGTLISLVGFFKCLGVPEKTGARPLITGAVVSNLLNLIINFAVGIVTLLAPQELDPVGVQILDTVGNLLAAITISLFLLFIKKVAEYVDNHSAAHEAWTLMIFYLSAIGAGIAFVFSVIFVGAILPRPLLLLYVIVFALGMIGALITWLIKYLTFLNTLEFRSSTRRKPRY